MLGSVAVVAKRPQVSAVVCERFHTSLTRCRFNRYDMMHLFGRPRSANGRAVFTHGMLAHIRQAQLLPAPRMYDLVIYFPPVNHLCAVYL